MGVDGEIGRHNVRGLRESDPELFLRAVAGAYNLRVNAGMKPDDALLQLVARMVDEGVNLPLVMQQHQTATQRFFQENPEVDDDLVTNTELRIDRRV